MLGETMSVQSKKNSQAQFVCWLGKNTWVLITPWVFGIILAMILPDNILTKKTWLLPWVNLISDLFPYITRAAHFSLFPEVTRVFQATMWTIAPIWLLFCLITPQDRSRHIDQLQRSKVSYFFLVFSYIVIVIISFFILFDDYSLSSAERIVSHSRFGLGFVGSLMMSGASVFALILIFVACRDCQSVSDQINVTNQSH